MDVLAPSWTGDTRKGDGGHACERLGGGPGFKARDYGLIGCATDLRPALDSIPAPNLLMRRRGDLDLRAGAFSGSRASGYRTPRLVEFDGDGACGSRATRIGYWTRSSRSSPVAQRPSIEPRAVHHSLHRHRRLDARASQAGDELGGDSRRAQPDRRTACGRRACTSSSSPATARSPTFDGPARAINCACAIRDAVEDSAYRSVLGCTPAKSRSLTATFTASGSTWPHASWALAGPDEVLVSGVMPPLVLGSRIAFDDRGSHELKGVPDSLPLFAVRDPRERN